MSTRRSSKAATVHYNAAWYFKQLWQFFAGAVLIVTAYQMIDPRVSISLTEPLDAKNPFSAYVTLTNQSWFNLHGVRFVLGVGESVGRDANSRPGHSMPEGYKFPTHLDHEMEIGTMVTDQAYTVPLSEFMEPSEPNGIQRATVAVIVSYSPRRLWFTRREIVFPLVSHRESDGHVYWLLRPVP